MKNCSVQTQGESSPSTKLAKYSEKHTRKLQQARQRLMVFGRQVFFLVTRTSLDHKSSLWPQGTHMLFLWNILLWWRPAISQPSVLPVLHRSFLLRLSVHQTLVLCQAWTLSQILVVEQPRKNSPYKKFAEATQKEKMRKAIKFKT